MLTSIVFAGLVLLFFRWALRMEPAPIAGIYSQPGRFYYLKYAVFYLIFTFRKWQSNRLRKAGTTGGKSQSNKSAGYGVVSKYDIAAMDCLQPLSDHPKAIDAVYFQGANKDGYYFVGSTARRPRHVINGMLFLKVPGEGLLLGVHQPDAAWFGTKDEFGAEGFLLEPVVPMREWKITFKGQMKRSETGERVDVEINAKWSSKLEHFDFDTDMSSKALSRAIAREPWSREYFDTLKEAHQTHYEQMGAINGSVKIAGKEYPLNLDSMRDHSYGHKREWKLLHRYGFHMMYLQDGTLLNVGIVSQPCTTSVLELGYVYMPDGRLFPVDECSFKLWENGENGEPPRDYHFTFKAANRTWSVQVNVLDSPVLYIGWEWEARIHERMCTFQVNGVPGWGISEFMYRNMSGRPEEFDRRDPEWTRQAGFNKG